MANDTKNHQRDKNAPMSIGKAIGGLLLIYVLIAGLAVWKIREICLLQRDNCGYHGLVETVLSEPLVMIASAIFLGLLIFITLHVLSRARDGTLGIEQDPPRRKFNINGFWVSLVVFLLYLGGSSMLLISGAVDPSQIDPDNANFFVWKTLGPLYGSAFVFIILWHLNDYFVKPAPAIVLLLLFAVTFGSIYLLIKSSILDV